MHALSLHWLLLLASMSACVVELGKELQVYELTGWRRVASMLGWRGLVLMSARVSTAGQRKLLQPPCLCREAYE